LNLRGALCFFNAPHLRYLILEQAIVPELLRRMPALQPFIDVFLHPITVDPKNTPRDNIMLSQPVTIGYLGLVTQLKGFPVFQAIAQAMKKRLGKKVSFVAIGHTKGRPLMKDLDCLDVLPKTSSLSHEEFTRLAASCHFICLPFSAALYALSPSGTLLDAVALQKPVIALDVAITRDLFARYGDIGYLCSTPEEICQTIDQIVKNVDCEHYRRQQTAIATACHARQPAELAKSYVKITRPLINQQP
jgi:glycosyltransferase involved in cell wall biosynthesis